MHVSTEERWDEVLSHSLKNLISLYSALSIIDVINKQYLYFTITIF